MVTMVSVRRLRRRCNCSRASTQALLISPDSWRHHFRCICSNIPVHSSNSDTTTLQSASTERDRKSTRLNSSHGYISYAVFCLKKKKRNHQYTRLHTHVHHPA